MAGGPVHETSVSDGERRGEVDEASVGYGALVASVRSTATESAPAFCVVRRRLTDQLAAVHLQHGHGAHLRALAPLTGERAGGDGERVAGDAVLRRHLQLRFGERHRPVRRVGGGGEVELRGRRVLAARRDSGEMPRSRDVRAASAGAGAGPARQRAPSRRWCPSGASFLAQAATRRAVQQRTKRDVRYMSDLGEQWDGRAAVTGGGTIGARAQESRKPACTSVGAGVV